MQNIETERELFEQRSEQKLLKTEKKHFKFKQQLVAAWQPKPTLICAIILYLSIFIIFIIFGVVTLINSNNIYELEIQYDNKCKNINEECIIELQINEDLKGPIFIYYVITNFFQNHRRYITSINRQQLRGEIITNESDCQTVKYNKDIEFAKLSINQTNLDPNDIAIPCGSAARAYFNDTYSITQDGQTNALEILDEGIAWQDDIEHKFKNQDLNKQWIDIESERFINWMKISPYPTIRKTWGKINQDMPKGKYKITINNLWDSSIFGGKKYFGITQTNVLGAQNFFLSYAFITIGCISFILGLIALIRKFQRPKGIVEQRIKNTSDLLKNDNT